jgi:GAF domain-containing protein/anti-sigma regulatory factor (Ser/Thr protein kinase)
MSDFEGPRRASSGPEPRRPESGSAPSPSDRAPDLLRVDGRLASATSSGELLDIAFEEAFTVSGATAGAIGLLDRDAIAFERIRGFPGKEDAWRRLPLSLDAPPTAAVRGGRPIYLQTRGELEQRFPGLGSRTVDHPGGRAAVPLVATSGVVGVLYLAFESPLELDGEDRAFLEDVATRCAHAAERMLLLESAQRSERRTRALQRVTAELAASIDAEEIVHIAVDGAREAVAANAVGVVMVGLDGRPGQLTAIGDQPARGEAAHWVVSTGRLQMFGSSEEMLAFDPSTAERSDELAAHTVVLIPIVGHERCLGVLQVERMPTQPFDERDVNLLLAIGGQCAIALERARHLAERELALARGQALQGLVAGLTRDHTVQEMAETVLAGVELLGAVRGSVGIVDDAGKELRIIAWRGYEEEAIGPFRTIDLSTSVPIAEACRRQEPIMLRSVEEAEARFPAIVEALRSFGGQATIAQPVVSGSRSVGCLAFTFAHPLEGEAGRLEVLDALAEHFAQAIERAQAYEAELATRGALERAMSRLGRLQGVTAALTPQLRTTEIASTILREVRAAFSADSAGLFVPEGGMLQPLGIAGVGSEAWDGAREVEIGSPLAVAEAYRSARTVWVPSKEEWRRRYPTAPPEFHAGMASVLAVPLLQGGEVRAVLGMLFRRAGALTKEERRLATTMGNQAAQALERARLYEAERRAARRIAHLQKVATALATAATPSEVADVVINDAIHVLGARSCAIGLIEETDRSIHVLAIGGADAAIDVADLVTRRTRWHATEAIAQRGAVLIPDREALRAAYPLLARAAAASVEHAWAALPLLTDQGAIGFLHLGFEAPQDFDDDQARELRSVTAQVAQAMDRALLFAREHEVARVLQDSLLPTGQHATSSPFEVATRYQPGAEHLEVGGDWYEVVALADGRLGIAVGDVVGRGLNAAAAMGQLRSALRAVALLGGGPAAVLDGLERFAEQTPGAALSSVVYGELDVDGTVRYSSAGHPPPILEQGGGVTILEDGRSPVLAVGATQPRDEGLATLVPGGSLFLYTDGLVERRGEAIDRGIQRLTRAMLATASMAPGERCDEILTRMLDGVDRDDDIALLCVTRPVVPAEFESTIPSAPTQLGPLRHRLAAWLRDLEVDPVLAQTLVLATNEAVANAVEHAHRDRNDEMIEVRAELREGEVTVEVRDHGTWRDSPSGSNRGRGLTVMRSLMDEVDVQRSDDGTQIRMRHHVAVG